MSTIFTLSETHINFVRKEDQPSILCNFVEQMLLSDQCSYFFHLMFNCPDRSPRLYCGQTVANVVNKGFKIVEKGEENP